MYATSVVVAFFIGLAALVVFVTLCTVVPTWRSLFLDSFTRSSRRPAELRERETVGRRR